jgi:hypothetical protein
MRLQIETKNKPRHASRLNRLVLGVAFLWLVTSVLILMLSAGSHGRKFEHKSDHTRKNAPQQLYAQVEHQATSRAFFTS